MGMMEKIARAKETTWVTDGISEVDIKTTIELARISARIERCRLDLQMTQKEFAEYMGVTQGMVSKWESREYNFTIKSLNEICQKLGLSLSMDIVQTCSKKDYKIIKWDEDIVAHKRKNNNWVGHLNYKEAIA